MKVFFGGKPISDLPSVQAIAREKKKTHAIWIMGGFLVLGSAVAYALYMENKELKLKLKNLIAEVEKKDETKEEKL